MIFLAKHKDKIIQNKNKTFKTTKVNIVALVDLEWILTIKANKKIIKVESIGMISKDFKKIQKLVKYCRLNNHSQAYSIKWILIEVENWTDNQIFIL